MTAAGADVEGSAERDRGRSAELPPPGRRQVQAVNTQFARRAKTKEDEAAPAAEVEVSALVLNGSNVAGEAANTAYLLTTRLHDEDAPAGDQANAPKVERNTTSTTTPSSRTRSRPRSSSAAVRSAHPRRADVDGDRRNAPGPATR